MLVESKFPQFHVDNELSIINYIPPEHYDNKFPAICKGFNIIVVNGRV